jgi:hypothetical protein
MATLVFVRESRIDRGWLLCISTHAAAHTARNETSDGECTTSWIRMGKFTHVSPVSSKTQADPAASPWVLSPHATGLDCSRYE